jgi:predicted nucleic acid-binding protein
MLKGNLPEVYLDTDVAFDIISKRTPHFEAAVKLLELVAQDKIALLIGECSLANLIYLSYDIYKLPDATSKLMDFIAVCQVISARKSQMLQALASPFRDKEDALQYYTALHNGADYFITRNITDYKYATQMLSVYTPQQFLNTISK